jgi:type I restriction enzyme S subunit
LISEGKIKRQKPLPAITEEEKPFELPKGWEWARLGDICSYIQRGKSPVYVNKSRYPVISQKCVRWAGLDLEVAKFIDEASLDKYENLRFLTPEDLLWNSTGTGTIGRACLVGVDNTYPTLVADSHVTVVRSLFINVNFLLYWIRSPFVQSKIEEAASGTTNQIELNTSTVISHLFPLPPANEMPRIVDKISELLVLCDQLEVLQSQQSNLQASTWQEVLNAITQASSTLDLTKAWQRLEQQLALLVTEPEQVKGLRDTILQLAVQGKLVPQDPNDEPASVLLTKIQAEKERLIKAGKIKRQKPLPPITDEEKPFELPKGWEWARWDDIALKIGDIDHKMPEQTKDGIPYISPRDFLPKNGIDFAQAKKIDISDFEKLALKIVPQRGDIIYPRYGTIGENRLIETDIKFLASYSCAVIKVLHGYIDPLYQFIFSVSPLAKNQAKAAENKTTQANVGLKSIQLYLVPLAPYDEQSRIAEKYNLLMSLCDQLEARLQAARQTQAQFALETVNNLSTQ